MCVRKTGPGGVVTVECTPADHANRRRVTRCSFCDRPVEVLCYQAAALAPSWVGRGKERCDRPCCRVHARQVEPGVWRCWSCWRQAVRDGAAPPPEPAPPAATRRRCRGCGRELQSRTALRCVTCERAGAGGTP